MIVYAITNWLDGHKYVGQTGRTIEARWKEHCASARQPSRVKQCPYLYAAMNKYGIENFEISEIDRADDRDKLDDIEELWIAKLGTTDRNRGYNISFGGSSRPHPETRARLSASLKGKPAWNKGKPMEEEHYKNCLAASKKKRGVPHNLTPDGRKKLSESRLGENNPNYGGKSMTEETRRRLGEAAKGRVAWNRGIPHTEEAKEKMRGPKPWAALPRPSIQGDKHPNFLNVSVEAMKQLRSIGFSYNKIAETLGCAHGTVTNRLKNWPNDLAEAA